MSTLIIIVLGTLAANLFVLVYTWAILIYLPSDYFVKDHDDHQINFLTILRNTLAGIVIISGIAMLFLPGPGLLTILAGVLLSKNRLKKNCLSLLLQNERLRNKIQDIRKSFNKDPFDLL